MLIRVIENFSFRAVNKPSCKIVGCRAFSKAGGGGGGDRGEEMGGGIEMRGGGRGCRPGEVCFSSLQPGGSSLIKAGTFGVRQLKSVDFKGQLKRSAILHHLSHAIVETRNRLRARRDRRDEIIEFPPRLHVPTFPFVVSLSLFLKLAREILGKNYMHRAFDELD